MKKKNGLRGKKIGKHEVMKGGNVKAKYGSTKKEKNNKKDGKTMMKKGKR